MVEGVSSDHSERQFSADVGYTIIIRTDLNDIASFNTDGDGDGNTWGIWDGADNLDFNDDDTIIFVDNYADDSSLHSSIWHSSSTVGYYFWRSDSYRFSGSLSLEESGELDVWQWDSRISSSSSNDFTLWQGSADMASYSESVNATVRAEITVGVLTSQGLVGIV